jgi:hypothetical protein
MIDILSLTTAPCMTHNGGWRCHMPQCLESCDSENVLFVHLKAIHDLDFTPETKTFSSRADFDVWFSSFKAQSQTSFTRSQDWKNGLGHHVVWRCGRSARRGEPLAAVKPTIATESTTRTNRSKPSMKLDHYCTCSIEECERPDGSMLVHVASFHNHWLSPTDLRSTPLSTDTRSFVATLIHLGLTDKAILRAVQADVFRWENRDEFDEVVTRDLLLTMQV